MGSGRGMGSGGRGMGSVLEGWEVGVRRRIG